MMKAENLPLHLICKSGNLKKLEEFFEMQLEAKEEVDIDAKNSAGKTGKKRNKKRERKKQRKEEEEEEEDSFVLSDSFSPLCSSYDSSKDGKSSNSKDAC
jgi:ribosomal protein L12E/L44/L45/RPP1/RPP2